MQRGKVRQFTVAAPLHGDNAPQEQEEGEARMEVLSMLLPLAAGLAAAVGLTVFITALKVNRVKLRAMSSDPVDLLAVPAPARAILDPGRQWLMARGFRYLSSFRYTPMVAGPGGDEKYGDVYMDEARAVFAVVSPREVPRPGDTTAIEFQSVFADGTACLTVNRTRHGLVHEESGWPVQDHYLGDLARVLERHVAWVAQSGKQPVADAALRERLSAERVTGFVDRIVEAGIAKRSDDGEVRIRFGHAVRYVVRLLRGNIRAAKVKPLPLGEPHAHPTLAKSAGVAADLQAYRTRRAFEGAMSSKGKLKTGLLSAAAFLVVGGWLWDWTYAAFILAVIAFHEGGHYVAMKWVGYANLQVFFIPGLGGLATGDKHDATVAQKVFVYLAGPVPGIVLGTAGFLLLPEAVLPDATMFLTILIVVNVFNLLPVTPLDGGRVMEILLFARWPLWRMLFAAGSCAALLGIGALTSDRVMMMIGVFVAMSLPTQWRFYRLARAVRRPSPAPLEDSAAARRVFGALNRPEFAKWGVQQRIAVADPLIAELRSPAPRVAGTLGGLAVYFACFAVPAGVALATSPTMRDMYDLVAEAREANAQAVAFVPDSGDGPPRDWMAELAATKGSPPERRLPVLVDAAEHEMLFDPKDQEELRRLAQARAAGDLLRVRGLMAATSEDDDHTATLRTLREELRADDEGSRRLRTRIDATLAMRMPRGDERLAALVASTAALEGEPTLVALKRATRRQLAHEREMHGDMAGAESDLRQAVAEAGSDEHSFLPDEARTSYLRFLMRRERWTDADALARPALEKVLDSGHPNRMALLRNLATTQALFWMAVHERREADAKRWLGAWEQALTHRAVERDATLAIARIAHAELAGDREAAARETKRLRSLAGLNYLCRPGARFQMLQDTPLAAHPRDVLSRSGACPRDAGEAVKM